MDLLLHGLLQGVLLIYVMGADYLSPGGSVFSRAKGRLADMVRDSDRELIFQYDFVF